MPVPSCWFTVSLLVVAAVSPVVLAAQQPQKVKLGHPEAEFAESFDNVTAIRELSDGRVVVSDVAAKTVSLVDMNRKTVTAIGREGQGPKEFSFPGPLVALPGDTTLMADIVQQRFLLINPDGVPADVIHFPSGFGFVVGNAIYADQKGRIYWQGGGALMRSRGRSKPTIDTRPDTLPLLRWDRANNSVDTVTWLLGAPTKHSKSANMSMVMALVFSGQDEWDVTPDGRVGIARVADYHVEWLGGPNRVAGAAVPFERIKVTDAEKDQVRKDLQGASSTKITVIGAAPGVKPPNFTRPDPEFADYKTPFADARATTDGQLWVQRTTTGSPTLYDVFDGNGQLIRHVELPKHTRLVGFGARAVYLARIDDDGMEWLGRYPRP